MSAQLVTFDFQSHAIPFTQDAHINLTAMCAAFGKRPVDFLKLDSTQRFMVALAADTGLSLKSKCEESSHLKCPESGHLNSLLTTIRGQHGGGTWAHPDLALECARWLSPEFAIWTNRMIRKLLSGEMLHSAQDARALARIECRIKQRQKPGTNACNQVATFPPAILCRVLNALGFKHAEPALKTILKAWQSMLPLRLLTANRQLRTAN